MSKSKKLTYKDYENLFYEWINAGKPIRTKDGTPLEMVDGEEWKMCYDPDDIARKDFPQNWILSDHYNLVSVSKKKVKLIKRCYNNSKYASHYFGIHTDKVTIKNKRISLHNLMAVVFGSDTYGKAGDLLRKDGLKAFGSFGSAGDVSDRINGHHKDKDPDNNSPDNIRLLSTDAHKLERTPNDPTDKEKLSSYLEKALKVAERENPNGITVILTGQEIDIKTGMVINDDGFRDIMSVQELELSPEAAMAYRQMIINALCIEN